MSGSASASPGTYRFSQVQSENCSNPDQSGLSLSLQFLRSAHSLWPHLPPAAHRGSVGRNQDPSKDYWSQKRIYFVDDNLTGHRDYAKELFRGLLPLNLRWSCLWTINTSRDEELLDLAKQAGCYHVNIGIENVCSESIEAIAKVQNPVQEYGHLLKKLQERSLFYSLIFMFGLDGDTTPLFDETLEFLEKIKAPMAFFNSVTPRRGTPLWEQLHQQGRVHNPEAEKYLGMICNFVPRHMTPEECEAGVWRCFQKFYSYSSICRRLLMPPNGYFLQGLPSNLYFPFCGEQKNRSGGFLLTENLEFFTCQNDRQAGINLGRCRQKSINY